MQWVVVVCGNARMFACRGPAVWGFMIRCVLLAENAGRSDVHVSVPCDPGASTPLPEKWDGTLFVYHHACDKQACISHMTACPRRHQHAGQMINHAISCMNAQLITLSESAHMCRHPQLAAIGNYTLAAVLNAAAEGAHGPGFLQGDFVDGQNAGLSYLTSNDSQTADVCLIKYPAGQSYAIEVSRPLGL